MKNIYTYTMKPTTILACLLLINIQFLNAQDDKIKFGAYARALQQQSNMTPADTTNPDNTSKGHVLMDLGINVNPDKKTEIQAIIRFNNNFNGFYTAGASATLRQLSVKGTVAKYFNYQVGDLYMKLTPYTFFNNTSEGAVNEASIFHNLRNDYTNYENLSNRGNAWWQQGAATNFSLAFNQSFLDTVRFDGFFLRNRASYAVIPSSFHAGGKITITQSSRLKLAGNYINLYDIGASTAIDTLSAQNPVATGEIEFKIINGQNAQLILIGEGGNSHYAFKDYKSTLRSGYFYDAGLQLNLRKQNLIITADYSFVSPQFYSSAAQTKRVDYTNTPATLTNYNNTLTRGISAFDLIIDPSIYNQGIVRTLMAYNPIYGNAQPYGKATPNRAGVNLNIQYKDSLERIIADVEAAYLSDIAGEGSSNLRKFLVLKGGVDVNIHKFLGWKKQITLSAGYSMESTKRGGDTLQSVSLVNSVLDLGLEVEVFKRISVLGGFKVLASQGNEFIAVRDKYNDITNFSAMKNINVGQGLIAAGLKYRFSEKSYLTAQYHIFNYQDNTTSANNYTLSQFLVMFNMNF
ncbi:MAG: hypothetical protein ACKOXB_11335 [Flavobacteriales bacterium]